MARLVLLAAHDSLCFRGVVDIRRDLRVGHDGRRSRHAFELDGVAAFDRHTDTRTVDSGRAGRESVCRPPAGHRRASLGVVPPSSGGGRGRPDDANEHARHADRDRRRRGDASEGEARTLVEVRSSQQAAKA